MTKDFNLALKRRVTFRADKVADIPVVPDRSSRADA